MKTASISTAKNTFSARIRQVQRGEPVLITDRGVPVARLVPVTLGKVFRLASSRSRSRAWCASPGRELDAAWLDLPRPEATPGPSIVDLFLEERREGR